jgi:hypothetical protein
MTAEDSLARPEIAADEIAQGHDAVVDSFQHPNGHWTVSMESRGGQ